MQSSTSHTSSLLNHAMRTRTKNMELRQKIAQLQTEVHNLEKDISSLTMTYDDLVEQCRILREQQTDENKQFLLKQSEKDFHQYIQDIENYIKNKQWKTSSMDKPSNSCTSSYIHSMRTSQIFFFLSTENISITRNQS